MKILFYPSGFLPLHAHSQQERALNEEESALIYFSAALAQLGHEVVVLTEESDPPPSNPLYLTTSAFPSLGTFDVVVAVKGWLKLFLPIQAQKRLFWTHDSARDLGTYGIGDRRFIEIVDYVISPNTHNAKEFIETAHVPSSKIKILPEEGNWEATAREFLKWFEEG